MIPTNGKVIVCPSWQDGIHHNRILVGRRPCEGTFIDSKYLLVYFLLAPAIWRFCIPRVDRRFVPFYIEIRMLRLMHQTESMAKFMARHAIKFILTFGGC